MEQQKKDFISQYLLYNAGNMSPKNYHLWCALSILAMTVGRKIYVDHAYYRIHCMLYITLVGRQGLRKTTAKDMAKNLFLEVFPDYPVGASVASREKIVERLASDDTLRAYQDETNSMIEFRPTAFFINELKNFMSINPGAMVEFLTDIYDTKFFASDTIKHGLQPVINPCINIIACETPKWLIEKLKLNIIAGGFSRRMLYIYEISRPTRITFPIKTPDSFQAEEWCKNHLRKISTIVGPFAWSADARVYFDEWFKNLPNQDDEILEGYYEAKDVLVQKIAMLLGVAQEEPTKTFTVDLLKLAISILESIELNLPKLTIAAGRNELAIPQQIILDLLEDHGGEMFEKEWHCRASRDMSEQEYSSVRSLLSKTDRIFEVTSKNGVVIYSPEKYHQLVKAGDIQLKKNGA